MPNLLDAIKNRIASEHPGATIVERGERHIIHRIGTLPDGRQQFAVDSAIGPLHYNDGVTWQECITDWIDSDKVGFSDKANLRYLPYVATNGDYRIYPRRGVATEYIAYTALEYWRTVGGGSWRSVGLIGKIRSNDALSWDNANMTVKVVAGSGKFKFLYVLKNANAPTRIRWTEALVGLHWVGDNLVSDADGTVVARFAAPAIIADSTGAQNRPVTVVRAGATVEFNIDLSWLVYPVTVDPTIDTTVGASADDAVVMDDGSGYDDTAVQHFLGKANQSYVFGARYTGINITAGATIDVATVTLYFNAGSTASNNYAVRFENANNPGTFSSGSTPDARTGTTASVSWSESDPFGSKTSPSLVTPLQEVVDGQSGTGAAVAVIIRNGTGGDYARSPVATYDSSSNVPAIHIEWTAAAAGGTKKLMLLGVG